MKKLLYIGIIAFLSYSNVQGLFKPEANITISWPKEPIKIQPDLSGLGAETGKIASEVFSEAIKAIPKGIIDATKDGEFGQLSQTGMENISQQFAEAFANALSDPRFKEQLSRGGSAWAGALGAGARGTRRGLERDVYPEIQQITQGAIGSVFNVRAYPKIPAILKSL